MSEPKVTDLFRAECSAKFGIRPQHALNAAANPDKTAVLEQDGLTLRIHSKFVEINRQPCFMIVVEQVQKEGSTINYALRAYPDLCDGFSDLGKESGSNLHF